MMVQSIGESADLPPYAAPGNHGNTVAAWVTVAIVIVGALTAALGVIVTSTALFVSGFAVIVGAVVVGRVLKMLGLGQPDRVRTAARSS